MANAVPGARFCRFVSRSGACKVAPMLKECSNLASRWVSYNVLLAALPAALLGCGSPAAPAAPTASAPVGAVPVTKEEAPDLTPVPAPAELVALARFRKPQTAIETVAAWANFPYK